MKWIKDKTGRFPLRPFYEPGELDRECESIMSSYLLQRHGSITYPLTTNDLTLLLEGEVEDLDLYADLTSYGDQVEGMTEFSPNKKPSVKITRDLSEEDRRENRLRTTLTHEFGHVKFHNFLWFFKQDKLFSTDIYENRPKEDKNAIICKRETILNANEVDWMEWQAGYASGAFLMPITVVKRIVNSFYPSIDSLSIVSSASSDGRRLIDLLQKEFQVSPDAARVRLVKLNYLAETARSPIF
jgi:Zn-dependent peptidase ImmA (M78 family)